MTRRTRGRPRPGLAGFLDDLEWRGILHATTPGLPARLASGRRIAAYIGFDPTADSLHAGHLIPIFGLLRLQRRGGRPVALVGGGTGMIGDPSGRSSERNLLDVPTLERNVAAIRAQLERFLDFSPGPAQAVMANNLDWLGKLSLIDYLRDVGQALHGPVHAGQGLRPAAARARPVVHRVQLHDAPGIRLRDPVPGARRRDADGRRRPVGEHHRGPGADPADERRPGGRREPGARDRVQAAALAVRREVRQERGRRVRLARSRPDDAVRLLPVLGRGGRPRRGRRTCAGSRSGTRDEIEALDAAIAARPEAREAQRRLAFDVTARVHGEAAATGAVAVSAALFQREPITDPALLASVHAATRGPSLAAERHRPGAWSCVLAETGLAPSRGEARRLIQGGAITRQRASG